MKLVETFLVGFTAFCTNKTRFLLTIAGITIGVALGLPMIAIGDDVTPIKGSLQMSRTITIDEVKPDFPNGAKFKPDRDIERRILL